MEQSFSSRANSYTASQNNFPPFMVLESSLPFSQEPTTRPYPEQDKSISRSFTLLLSQQF
jgi:hypothetical protein